MQYEDYPTEAVHMVSAWPDVPDEDFAQVVTDQAKLMTGFNPDELWEDPPDTY
jgi:hypothetical protein